MGKKLLLPSDNIESLYINGKTISEISNIYSCSTATIKKNLLSSNVKLRDSKQRSILALGNPLIYDDKFNKKVVDEYLILNSYNKVSKRFKVSKWIIISIIKKNNIKSSPYKFTEKERQMRSQIQIGLWKNLKYAKMQSQSHKGYKSNKKGKTLKELHGEKKSMEIKHKQSQSHLGNVPWNKGLTKKDSLSLSRGIIKAVNKRKKNGSYKISQSTKDKIRNSLKGVPKSKQHINKVRKALIGKKYSKEKYPNWGWRTSRKNQIFPKKDTKIEIKIQNLLSKLHLEFYTHKYMSEINHSYQCDIFIPIQKGISQNTIIECDGCFFHCCPICKPKEYYWTKERQEMDKIRTKELEEKGFRVIRLWEHEIRKMELNELKIKL